MQARIVKTYLRTWPFLGLVFLLCWPAEGQDLTWLPATSQHGERILDPKAHQQSISLFQMTPVDTVQQAFYVPIGLSMRKALLANCAGKERYTEAGIQFTIHSQFLIQDLGTAYMGGLQNADYRIAAYADFQQGTLSYHLELFHQSSHLGDDHIIRNGITTPTLRHLNYEELSVQVAHRQGGLTSYAGLGVNVSPNTIRHRLLFQAGGEWRGSLWRWGAGPTAACDVQWHGEHDFTPERRVALGVFIPTPGGQSIYLLGNAFWGHRPYSTLDADPLRLLGVSLILPHPQIPR